MKTLTKYITSIYTDYCYDINTGANRSYRFSGDGQGDFEQIADKISSRTLLDDYEKYLLEQLDILDRLKYNDEIIARENY